jgi:hypothetical protein
LQLSKRKGNIGGHRQTHFPEAPPLSRWG